MNPDEDHQKHNNILKFILDQNVYPEFQVKILWGPGHMALHHWTPYNGYMSQKKLYKYRSKAQHYLHHCKACKKTSENCLKLLQFELIITEDSFYLLCSVNQFFLLSLLKITSSIPLCLFSNIQLPYKL